MNFSSAGSSDPEGQPLTYSWTFGDGGTSTAANPTHTYTQAGQYTARLSVSDGTNSDALDADHDQGRHAADGDDPHAAGRSDLPGRGRDLFQRQCYRPRRRHAAGERLHLEHRLPPRGARASGHAQTGVKSGTFTIPTTGHDFSGNTRYRITLTVTDSDGLTTTTSVIIWPQKVNLTFDTVPAGLTLYLDGIAKTTPFVYDTLVGFNHTIEARNQSVGTTSYTFASWSDSGAQTAHDRRAERHADVHRDLQRRHGSVHASVRPGGQLDTAERIRPRSRRRSPRRRPLGDLNVVVIGWNNTTSNISSVTDSRGNIYQVAAAITRSGAVSQAIYYAKNIAAGANTVTVTASGSTPYLDIRIAEYSGLDLASPFDVTASASGSSASPSSGAATTRSATELLVGAGTTTGAFTGPGSGYTTRIITTPDADILEDRVVTTSGSYTATAAMTNSSWVMQLVAFRAAGQ